MRVARSCFVAFALALTTAVPRVAAAQTIPSPYAFVEQRQEVGVFAGWVNAGSGRFGYGPKEGLALGLRYGIDLSGPLSFEGSVGVMDGTRDVVTPTLPEGQGAIGEADIVISVNVDEDLRAISHKSLRSVKRFGDLIMTMMLTQLDEDLKNMGDLEIRPCLVGIPLYSRSEKDALSAMRAGEEAAIKVVPTIRALMSRKLAKL